VGTVETEASSRTFGMAMWAAWALVFAIVAGGAVLLERYVLGVFSSASIALGCFACAIILWLGFGVLLVTRTSHRKEMILSQLARKVTSKLLVPVAMLLGRAVGISWERLAGSFIEMNNKAVMHRRYSLTPDEVLVLLPQCLQNQDCQRRLSPSIFNCARCGRCDIADLVELLERYGLSASVVPGGTLARKLVELRKPKVIIAVACEREIFTGIQDTHPIPVISIINQRPNGPCVDTTVSVAKVKRAIELVLGRPGTRLLSQPSAGVQTIKTTEEVDGAPST